MYSAQGRDSLRYRSCSPSRADREESMTLAERQVRLDLPAHAQATSSTFSTCTRNRSKPQSPRPTAGNETREPSLPMHTPARAPEMTPEVRTPETTSIPKIALVQLVEAKRPTPRDNLHQTPRGKQSKQFLK